MSHTHLYFDGFPQLMCSIEYLHRWCQPTWRSNYQVHLHRHTNTSFEPKCFSIIQALLIHEAALKGKHSYHWSHLIFVCLVLEGYENFHIWTKFNLFICIELGKVSFKMFLYRGKWILHVFLQLSWRMKYHLEKNLSPVLKPRPL